MKMYIQEKQHSIKTYPNTLTPGVQTKLKIGRPGDKYEREADAFADNVMRMSQAETMQMQPIEEEEEMMQPKLRMQPMEEEEEMLQTKIQMQEEEEEEPLQMKCKECEQEEMLQTKLKSSVASAPEDVTQKINGTKGQGSPLPEPTMQFMSNALGADFTKVNLHNNTNAHNLNQSLGARAFTVGNNIYFNKGEYRPESPSGKKLLAHELTHVVQQTGNSIRKQAAKVAPPQTIQRNGLGIRGRTGLYNPVQPMVQKQEETDQQADDNQEGMTLEEIGEASRDAILRHPPALANLSSNRVDDVSHFMTGIQESNRYYYTLNEIHMGFLGLAFQLLQAEGETTEDQRNRFIELQSDFVYARQAIEEDTIAGIRSSLNTTRRRIEEIQLQLVLVYRQVYLSGEDSTTEIIISETNEETATLRGIADQITGLLSAINDADVALSGRQVAPVLTALSQATQFLNLILGWNFTGELNSASQAAFDDLQNGLAIGFTAASFTAASAYLPMFSHIPVLLGTISQQWDRVVEGLRSQNTDWWEAFGSMPYCSEEPGGCDTLNYMVSVFEASSFMEVSSPPEEAADFFLSRREMFNSVAREVMVSRGVPTESEYIIFTVIDDDSFKAWVHYNKEWIWKLIYGERSFPDPGGD